MTGRWRPLPSSLAPEVAYLVALLRELKDRSGLSLATLAAKTTYSKSSWERYLNGTTLPPRDAVQELGRLAGEPVERLLALWERAEAPWSRRAGETRPAATEFQAAATEPQAAATESQAVATAAATDRRPSPAKFRPSGWQVAALAAGVLAAALIVAARPLGIVGLFAPTGPSTSSVSAPVTVGCRGIQCAGQDAYDTACDIDAASFADLQVGRTYVELRISDECGAAWARISHSAVGDQVQVLDQDGRTAAVTVPDDASTSRYLPTRMLPVGRHSQVRACYKSSNGERRCTPWGADHPVPVRPPRASAPALHTAPHRGLAAHLAGHGVCSEPTCPWHCGGWVMTLRNLSVTSCAPVLHIRTYVRQDHLRTSGGDRDGR